MPRELFDQPSVCHPILPYDPVSHRLSFFRITVFDSELPLNVDFPDKPHGAPTHVIGHDGGYVDSRRVKLGIPLSDLFPDLLPELPAGIYKGKDTQFRIGSNRTFLPARSVNRRFSGARSVKLTTAKEGLGGPDAYKDLLKSFGDAELDTLRSGGAVTIIRDRELLRFSMDERPAAAHAQPEARSAKSMRREGVPPEDSTTLSDAAYMEVMELLFEGKPSATFHLEGLTEVGVNGFRTSYEMDRRARAYGRRWKLSSSRLGRSKSSYPTYEIGFLSQFEQEWALTGYSRGSMVSSFTLAPNEDVTLEVFTWDRSKLETQNEVTSEFERNIEAGSLTKVSAQVSRELSETTDRSAGIGLGVSLPIEGIPVEVDGNADVSNSIEEGMQSSVDTINEATSRASERFKVTNQVKVVQTRETGREERVTRRIKNPNLGHTLTLHCFEAVEQYTVTTRLRSREPQFVLLVDFPRPKRFDVEYVLAYQDKLQRALLSLEYRGGFDAAKKLLAQRFFDDRSLLKTEIDTAQTKARAEKAVDSAPAPAIVAVAKSIRKIINKLKGVDLVDEVRTLAESYAPWGPKVDESERADAHEALGRFNFWLKFKMVTPGVEGKAIDFVKSLPGSPTPKEAYEALQSFVPGLDDEWMTTVKMVAANLVSAQLALTLLIPFPWLAPILLEFAMIENSMGLPSLIEKAKKEVRSYEMAASVPLAAQGTNADGKTALPPPLPPPQLYSLAELSEADAEFRKLALHLEANAVYYMNFIISQEDVNVRYEKMKLLGIHHVVENRLLGFVGRKAVFPLRVESLETETQEYLHSKLLAGWLDSNGEPQLPAVTAATTAVALPSGGLYMEASRGQCDVLEPYMRDRRAIDLRVRAAEAARAEAEALLRTEEVNRLRARLAKSPPLLDPPFALPLTEIDAGDDSDDGV